VDYKWEDLIDAVNITFASYGFICSFFPILQEMQDGSYKNGMIAVFFGLLFCFVVYALFAILALIIYGHDI
jgi:amino acid permease